MGSWLPSSTSVATPWPTCSPNKGQTRTEYRRARWLDGSPFTPKWLKEQYGLALQPRLLMNMRSSPSKTLKLRGGRPTRRRGRGLPRRRGTQGEAGEQERSSRGAWGITGPTHRSRRSARRSCGSAVTASDGRGLGCSCAAVFATAARSELGSVASTRTFPPPPPFKILGSTSCASPARCYGAAAVGRLLRIKPSACTKIANHLQEASIREEGGPSFKDFERGGIL